MFLRHSNNLKTLVNHQLNRSFRVFSLIQNKNTKLNRQVKVLGKLLSDRKSGTKKKWYPETTNPILPSASSLSNTVKQGKNANRRVNILNKLFMKNITDLLATGEISEKIVGKHLEISRVKVSNDFNHINVFWIAKGNENDEYLEQTLQRYSGLLRHELSQLRLMGEVPRIFFIKDQLYSNLAEVEILLRKCDFGDDYETDSTIDKANEIKNELNLETNYNLLSQESEPDRLDSIPIMRHDVLGLNHKEVMGKIFTKLKKSKDAWEQHLSGLDTTKEIKTEPQGISNVLEQIKDSQIEKEEEFKKLLQKNKKNRPDRKKHLNNLDLNIYDDTFEQYEDERYFIGKNDEEDYIEEEDKKL